MIIGIFAIFCVSHYYVLHFLSVDAKTVTFYRGKHWYPTVNVCA
jgi:hypothetical protein